MLLAVLGGLHSDFEQRWRAQCTCPSPLFVCGGGPILRFLSATLLVKVSGGGHIRQSALLLHVRFTFS